MTQNQWENYLPVGINASLDLSVDPGSDTEHEGSKKEIWDSKKIGLQVSLEQIFDNQLEEFSRSGGKIFDVSGYQNSQPQASKFVTENLS